LPVVIDGGRVGLPIDGHPSTFILKPGSRSRNHGGELRFPELVANEAFCLAMAAELDLPVAAFSVLVVEGESVLAVERFDRRRLETGGIARIHQEDVCQALRIWPQHKYESGGGPGLSRVGALLGEASVQPLLDRRSLLRLAIFNMLIGNADAHGKNLSVLHEQAGVRLAPAYDLVATQIYTHSDTLGIFLGPARRLREVDRAALVAAGAACGFASAASESLVGELLRGVEPAIEAATARARGEGWWCEPLELVIAGIRERTTRIAEAPPSRTR
jgi:serine/threonine-protein kinase HipA